jgi:hypothetical protein
LKSFETKSAELLAQYETADARQIARRKRNADFLTKDRADEELKKSALAGLKELYATIKDGPPDGWEKTSTPATGIAYKVRVIFAKGSDFYEPTMLPSKVLTLPGVVKSVVKEEVDRLVAEYPAVAQALRPGECRRRGSRSSRSRRDRVAGLGRPCSAGPWAKRVGPVRSRRPPLAPDRGHGEARGGRGEQGLERRR